MNFYNFSSQPLSPIKSLKRLILISFGNLYFLATKERDRLDFRRFLASDLRSIDREERDLLGRFVRSFLAFST